MAFTMDDYNALDRAIATGTRRAKHGDVEVTFHSLEDMLKLRARMAEELGLNGSQEATPRIVRPIVRSGF